MGVWYKVTLLFTEHGPVLYLTTETDPFSKIYLVCQTAISMDVVREKVALNKTFSNAKLLIARL